MAGFGLFDEEDYSLMRQPRQYSNPTGRADPTQPPADPGILDRIKSSFGNEPGQFGWQQAAEAFAVGRNPNALLPVLEMRNQRARDAERDKLVKEKAELDKYKGIWDIVEKVGDTGIVKDVEQGKQLGKIIAEKFGAPDMADFIGEAISSKDTREQIKRVFPAMYRKYGDDVFQLARNPAFRQKLPEFDKIARGEETFNQISGDFRKGLIPANISMAELEDKYPGAMANLDDEKTHALNQLGLVNLKTKGVMEVEAKAGIETKAQQMVQARADKAQEYREQRDAVQDAKWQAQMNQSLMLAREAGARGDARQADINARQAKYLEAALSRPLEQGDREAIAAMEDNLRIVRRLKTEFTKEELKEYVGILNNPMSRAAQAFRDPESPQAKKFAQFRTLSDEVKGFAFAQGGKALTGTEKEITFGYLPIGNEINMANYIANLDRAEKRTADIIERRIQLATTPRSRIQPATGSGADATPGPTGSATAAPAQGAAPTATPARAPAPPKVGEVRDGYVFMGGNPADRASWKLEVKKK
jgi:hypothetical protein